MLADSESRVKMLFRDLFWVAAFIAVHLLVLVSIGTEIRFTEEIYNGKIAYYIMHHGLTFNRHLQFAAFAGGTFIEGLLLIPAFKLFGMNLFALKFVPILFSAGALWIWRVFLRRNFSVTAAGAMSWLMLFSPPFFTKISCVAWGNHLESTLLLAVGLLLFDLSTHNAHPHIGAFLFGIWSGFSFYFIPSYLLLLVAAGISLLIISVKNYNWFQYRYFAPGMLIGLIPWIYVNLVWNFQGVGIFRKFNTVDAHSFARLGRLILKNIPVSTGFIPGYGRNTLVLGLAYWGIAIFLAAGYVMYRGRKKKLPGLLPIGIYIILFCIAAAVGNFKFKPVSPAVAFRSFRYLAPVYPMFLAFIACGYAAWQQSGKLFIRRLVTILLIILISAGAISTARMIKPPASWNKVFAPVDYRGLVTSRNIMKFRE